MINGKKRRAIISMFLVTILVLLMVPSVNAAAISPSVVVTSTMAGDTLETWTVTFAAATTIPVAGGNNSIVINLAGQNLGGVVAGDVTVVDGLTGVGVKTINDGTKDITIQFTGALNAGEVVMITIDKVTNGAAGAHTQTVTTKDDGADTDTGTDSITLMASGYVQQAMVGQAAEVSITGGTSFNYTVDPSVSTQETHTNAVSVRTNARSGYNVKVYASQQLTHSADGSKTIPAFAGTNAAPADPGATAGFGYNISGANKPAQFDAGEYAGFGLVGPGDIVMSATGPTGNTAHTITTTYRVAVDWTISATKPTEFYSNTVYYVFTPTF